MPAHCKTNADIEVFPERMLCPQCKEGRLMQSGMSGKSIQVGPHWRFAQHKCNRCGWTKRMARQYFGVEEADPEPEESPTPAGSHRENKQTNHHEGDHREVGHETDVLGVNDGATLGAFGDETGSHPKEEPALGTLISRK